MSYPQGYLYQPSASLALYSCPAYSTSVISGPRTDELGRSSSGSAFSPYAGSTAFTAPSPGYNSHLQYGADPAAAAAAAFSSYVVSERAPGRARVAGARPEGGEPWGGAGLGVSVPSEPRGPCKLGTIASLGFARPRAPELLRQEEHVWVARAAEGKSLQGRGRCNPRATFSSKLCAAPQNFLFYPFLFCLVFILPFF